MVYVVFHFFGLLTTCFSRDSAGCKGLMNPWGWQWYPLRNPPEKLMRLEDFLPRKRIERNHEPTGYLAWQPNKSSYHVRQSAPGGQNGFGPQNHGVSTWQRFWHCKPSTEIRRVHVWLGACFGGFPLTVAPANVSHCQQSCVALQLGKKQIDIVLCSKFKLNVELTPVTVLQRLKKIAMSFFWMPGTSSTEPKPGGWITIKLPTIWWRRFFPSTEEANLHPRRLPWNLSHLLC